MKIESSHLALRFYVADEWTKEKVEKYLIEGSIEHCFPFDEYSYYRPSIDAIMNCKAMIQDGHKVVRWYEGRLEQVTDLEYLEGFNKGEKNEPAKT